MEFLTYQTTDFYGDGRRGDFIARTFPKHRDDGVPVILELASV